MCNSIIAYLFTTKTVLSLEGYILHTNDKFDSSIPNGIPFVFQIGQNKVIQGWEQGLLK